MLNIWKQWTYFVKEFFVVFTCACITVPALGSGARLPRFESQPWNLSAKWSRRNCLTSSFPSFPIRKAGIIILSTLSVCYKTLSPALLLRKWLLLPTVKQALSINLLPISGYFLSVNFTLWLLIFFTLIATVMLLHIIGTLITWFTLSGVLLFLFA